MREDTIFTIRSITLVAEKTYALRFHAPRIAHTVQPGQFVNILTGRSCEPLLRRPYSISNVEGDECEILFSLAGKGTNNLACKRVGDEIDVLGPLGNSFTIPADIDVAVILAGGIGVAPFPLLTAHLRSTGARFETFAAVRTASRLVTRGLERVHVATDDGSEGYHGNVLACFKEWLQSNDPGRVKIFACGPTPMLVAVQSYALEAGIDCELSLESEMACGIGICQGCPIEHENFPRKYALVCTDGPCFDARFIRFKKAGGV